MGEEELFQLEVRERLEARPFVDGTRRLRGYSASENAWYEVTEYEASGETSPSSGSLKETSARRKEPYLPDDIIWE